MSSESGRINYSNDLIASISHACDRFLNWLHQKGYESYDPYDIWGTRYGLWSRRIYYANGFLGVPLVAPIVLMDMVCPELRAFLVRKNRYATADAQLLMAFLNVHEYSGEKRYLEKAVAMGEELLTYAIPGYCGPCWGYPFDWRINKNEVWSRNTPYITCTPYCYEAYLRLYDVTDDPKYLDIMLGIAEFIHIDINDMTTGFESSAGSYSPFDTRRVVNASAYRAFVLFESGFRFKRQDYIDTANRNLNFVLESQREDGSWYYAMEGTRSFIDNFHTCFNLKNLYKINRIISSVQVTSSISRGYEYYRSNLIDSDYNPRSFAVVPRFQLSRLEMYDFAEGVMLGSLLGNDIPEAWELAMSLANKLITLHQLPDGYFVTRVFRGGIRHRFPFLRWPQAQILLALTHMIRCAQENYSKN